MRNATSKLAAIALLLNFQQALAIVVDQQHGTSEVLTAHLVLSMQFTAQSVTAGVKGVLDSVELRLRRESSASPLFLDILPVIGGAPDTNFSNSLATVEIRGADVPTATYDWIPVDLSPFMLILNPGDKFAIALRAGAPLGNGYAWAFTKSNTVPDYVGGAFFVMLNPNSGSATWHSATSPTQDFMFRTIMRVVPVPATAWLFGSGLISLWCMWRRTLCHNRYPV